MRSVCSTAKFSDGICDGTQILASQNLHLYQVLTSARDNGVGVRGVGWAGGDSAGKIESIELPLPLSLCFFVVERSSRQRPALPAEFFDGVSDGSFRGRKNGRENYRQIESLDLTVVLPAPYRRWLTEGQSAPKYLLAPAHYNRELGRSRIGFHWRSRSLDSSSEMFGR
jgi:hypothetical protein